MSNNKQINTALIRKQVGKNRAYLVKLICDLVKIRSYSGEEEEIQCFLKRKLDELGMETKLVLVEPEKLMQYKGFSHDGFPYEHRCSLVGVKKGTQTGGRAVTGQSSHCSQVSAGSKNVKENQAKDNYCGALSDSRSLILNGHVDIVPPGDLDRWNDDPLSGRYKNGKIYGRGTLDMKGGLAAGITAVRVLQEMGFNNHGDISIASVCGEETGGCGAFALVEDGINADGCIILEPTSLKICHIQSGCHTFKLKLRGFSVHACMAYKGINVIDKFYLIYDALKAMDKRRHERFGSKNARYYENPSNVAPLNVGMLTTGEWPSSVPDRLEADGRIGIFPGETVEDMHREFEETVRIAADSDPWLRCNQPGVEWYEGLFEPVEVPIESDLIKTLAASHRDMLGRNVEYEAATYGSDMRIFNLYANIPTIMYGPGDVSLAHTVNEHIEIEDVLEAVRSLVLMLINWCGGDFPITR